MQVKDHKASEPRRFWPQAVGRTFELTAELEDLTAARRACESLREAGITDDCVVVLGQLGEEVSAHSGLCADERIVVGEMTWRIVLGAAIGALVGGLLSLLVGLVAVGTGSGLWAAIIAGAVFGAGIGSMIGGVAGTRVVFSRKDLHRRHPEFEHVMLGVHTDTPADVTRSAEILRGLGVVRLEILPAAPAAS